MQAVECDVTQLTRDCRLFDSAPSEIVLPDGTSFPNPRKPKTESAINDSSGPFGYGAVVLDQKAIDAQNLLLGEMVQVKSRLASVLNKEKNLSEDFKMNLLSDPLGSLFRVDMDSNGRFVKFPNMSPDQNKVKFFWPPDGKPSSSYQDIALDDLVGFLNSKNLSVETRAELKRVVDLQKKYNGIFNDYSKRQVEVDQQKQKDRSEQLKKRKVKARELIDVAKKAFKKVFDANSNQGHASDLKITLEKLTFKFEDEVPESVKKKSCANGPNAFYHPPLHTFVICDSILNYPDNQLVGIIGHEMGHSIGSCSLSLGLDLVDPKMLASFVTRPSANASMVDNLVLDKVHSALPSNNAVRIGNDFFMSEAFMKYADSVKLYTPLAQKIPNENYPFASARDCIVSNSKFRQVSPDDGVKMTKKTVEVFKEQGIDFSDADKKSLLERNNRSVECLDGFDHVSETEEAIADMWGSLAMEEYLTQKPAQTEIEKLSLYSFFGSNYCSSYIEKPVYTSTVRPQQFSLSALRTIAQTGRMQEQQRMNREHPPAEVRLNDVYFSLPKIAKSLGCDPGKNIDCFEKLRNFSKYQAAASKVPPKGSNGENQNMIEVQK